MSHDFARESRSGADAHEASGGSIPDRLLTVPEVAELLNVGERFVRRLVAERRITVVHVGRHVRIPGSAVAEYLAAGTVLPLISSGSPAANVRWAA